MTPATSLSPKIVRAGMQNRLIIANSVSAPPLVAVGGRFNSERVKIFHPAFDRFRHFADQAGRLPPKTHRQAHQ